LRDRHRNHFLLQSPAANCFRCALLAPQGEGILILASDMKLFGYDFAVSGMVSTPYFAFISGLTNRQPIVVSSNFMAREYAPSALPMTNGARDMLSTPPANHQLGFAALDRTRCGRHGIHA